MLKWSACLPSTPKIRVLILLMFMSTILLCKNYLKRAKINDEEASNGRSKTYVVNLFQSKYLPNTLLASNPISNVR